MSNSSRVSEVEIPATTVTTDENKVNITAQIEELNNKITDLQSRDPSGTASPYYNLITDMIQKAEELIANRPAGYLDAINKVRSTGNFANARTYATDEELSKGFDLISNLLETPASANLTELKKFSDKLPSSEYKEAFNNICVASIVAALAMATMFFPPIGVVTLPVIGAISIATIAVSAVAGFAVHISLKRVGEYAEKEVFESERFKLLSSIKQIDSGKDLFSTKLKEIEDELKANRITQTAANKSILVLNNTATQFSNTGTINEKELSEKIKAAIKTDAEEWTIPKAIRTAAKAFSVAREKHPIFAAVIAVAVVAEAALSIMNPVAGIGLCLNVLAGLATSAAYEAVKVAPKVATSIMNKTLSMKLTFRTPKSIFRN